MTIVLAILNDYDGGTVRRDFRDLAPELMRRAHRVEKMAGTIDGGGNGRTC